MESKFPTNWDLYPLEACMDLIMDYRGKTPNKTEYGVPLVTAKVVKNGRIETEGKQEYIAFDDFDAWMRRGLPKAGDIVITTEAPMGEVAQLGNRKVALAQRLITLRGKKGFLDNTFLRYLLQSEYFQNQLKAKATGTTVLGIKQSELRKILLPIPPIKEQERIGNIVSSFDNKIDICQGMSKTLEDIVRIIFKSWFVDFDPVRAKSEGRNSALPIEIDTLFSSSFDETSQGQVPSGWKVQSLLDFANLLSGGTPKTTISEYWNGDVLWVSAKDVSQSQGIYITETEKKITSLGVKKSNTKILPKNTTIITARGTVGAYVLLGREMAINQTNYGLRSKFENSEYFLFFLVTNLLNELKQNAYGTIFDTITTTTFQNTKTVVPPVNVFQCFNDYVFPFMEKILINTLETETLIEMRNDFVTKLLAGESAKSLHFSG